MQADQPPRDSAWAARHGLIVRADALREHGDIAVRRLLSPQGPWSRLLPGIYATSSAVDPTTQQLAAALLYGGATAQLGSLSACRLLGAQGLPESDIVHLLVDARTPRAAVPNVVIRATLRLPRPLLLDADGRALAVSPLARGAVDASRDLGDLQAVRALLCQLVQQGRVSVEALHEELRRGHSSGSALPRRVLRELRAGIRSAPEAEAWDLVRSSRVLPAPICNPRLVDAAGRFVACPDGYFWQSGVVYEVNSRRHHAGDDDWEATMERAARLESLGLRVVPFSPRQLRREGPSLLARLEAVHRQGLRTGPPRAVRIGRLADGSAWTPERRAS